MTHQKKEEESSDKVDHWSPLGTAVKGESLQNEMLPRLRRPHSLKKKAKLAIFVIVRDLLNRNMILREEAVLKIDLLGKELTPGITGDRSAP